MGIEILMIILFSTLFFGALMAGFFGFQSISEERLREAGQALRPEGGASDRASSDRAFFFDAPPTMETGRDFGEGQARMLLAQNGDPAVIRNRIVRDLQERITRELSLPTSSLFEQQSLRDQDTIQ